MTKNTIVCPQCETKIDIKKVLGEQIESEFQARYDAKIQEVEAQKNDLKQQVESKVQSQLQKERQKQESSIKQKLAEQYQEQIQSMQGDLKDQNEQLKDYHKKQAEVAKLKREKDQLESKFRSEAEQTITQQINIEKQKIEQQLQTTHQFKIQELEKQLLDQKRLTEEMQRKHSQGSMQLQGEVQELAIESWLTQQFPYDDVMEIKKGAAGGDCLQTVNTQRHSACGTIYYESKRTKNFQPAWIEKFKKDMQEKKADIGVLVTQSLPKDWKRMGQIQGIWVCSFEEFKSLCKVLREAIVQIHQQKKVNENRGDKMVLLYDYMTSNSFKMQIQAIVEGFTQLKNDLEKEKRAMQRIWKTREAQIEKVLTNTVEMYGSVKGLAGPSIGSIEALDIFEDDEST